MKCNTEDPSLRLSIKYYCNFENDHILKELDTIKCVQFLGITLSAIHKYTSSRLMFLYCVNPEE